jgi:hypothetical protein
MGVDRRSPIREIHRAARRHAATIAIGFRLRIEIRGKFKFGFSGDLHFHVLFT